MVSGVLKEYILLSGEALTVNVLLSRVDPPRFRSQVDSIP